MKNLYKLFTLTMGLLALSACEADRDSNPVLNEPDTFVLNVPALLPTTCTTLKLRIIGINLYTTGLRDSDGNHLFSTNFTGRKFR